MKCISALFPAKAHHFASHNFAQSRESSNLPNLVRRCFAEAMPGAHGDGCGCKPEAELGVGEFLLSYINKEGIRGINEQVVGSAKKTIRPYDERLDESQFCRSEEGDAELIIYIPFLSPCKKVTSLIVIGGAEGKAPSKLKLFANREDLDFSNVRDTECIQELELSEDFHGSLEYPLKVTKLQNVSSLSLYFPENFGGGCTEIFYIGLRGVGSKYQRKAVQTVYEAQANVKDHKQPGDMFVPQMGI
ncbi:hypothetical protein Esti_000171 [Eimeria stiedai]